MLRRLIRLSLVSLCLLTFLTRAPQPALARDLPAPLCVLITGQVFCYDIYLTAPNPVTPPDQQVIDFAIAPDGNWIAYRTADTVTIAPINDDRGSQQVDPQAIPPAALGIFKTTIAWSPDGLAIAYVTANGFRVAFPGADKPQYVDNNEREVIDLRFSPSGVRLAAQADDGSWTLFTIQSGVDSLAVQRTRTINQAADVAWLDDTNLVVAFVAGGLARIDATSAAQAPAWTAGTGHYTKLIASSEGQIFALNPDPGDTIGSAVSISADGTVTPVGSSKIDAQVQWGPDGAIMYYITSGTPILVDRATGAENRLRINRVIRLVWGPPIPPLASSIPLDADISFLAPDANGVQQAWRLSRVGLDPVSQITSQSTPVLRLGDAGIAPDSGVILPANAQKLIGQTWLIPDARYASDKSILLLRRLGWRSGPDVIQLYTVKTDSAGKALKPEVRSHPFISSNPHLSPTGRYIMGSQRFGTIDQLAILDMQSGRRVRIQGSDGLTVFQWVP